MGYMKHSQARRACKGTAGLCRRQFLLAASAALAAASRGMCEQSALPQFILTTTDGASHSGPLTRLERDWSFSLGGDKPARVVGESVISCRQQGSALPSFPAGEQLLCSSGDRLAGTVQGLDGDNLLLRPAFDGRVTLSVPLVVVAVIWFGAPDGVRRADLLQRRLLREQRSRDVLLLRNGDLVEGTLASLDARALRFEGENKTNREARRSATAAVAFNTELVRVPAVPPTIARLVLKDGSRLFLTSAEAAEQRLTGMTLFEEKVAIPLDKVIAIDLRHARIVYLSDLKPKSFEHTPYLGLRWPLGVDVNAAGRELRLAGSTYDKGLGMHSAQRVTYDLTGGYRRFEALVGLDDQSGRQGNARIGVLLDGQPCALGWDGVLDSRAGPRAVRVDVSKKHELTVVVDFGRGGDVQDHVNWADARLIK